MCALKVIPLNTDEKPKFQRQSSDSSINMLKIRGKFLSPRSLANQDPRATEALLWPDSLRQEILNSFKRPVNEVKLLEFLKQHNWPIGLYHNMVKSAKKLPLRFYIVDDSGSMLTLDGSLVQYSGDSAKMSASSRWDELKATLDFIATMSEIANIPSEFRLLNGAEPVIVGLGDDDGEGLKFALESFTDPPAGMTPLCAHIQCVVSLIQSISSELIANNQKVSVVIMTDGIATDGNVIDYLRPLENLPVLIVIRLCTSEQSVVDYWDNIDKYLELNIDVVSSLESEAKQIYELNPWLTYGEPLHRLREFGAAAKEFDLIDEVILGKEQIRAVCRFLFTDGTHPEEIPHPEADWQEFMRAVKHLNKKEQQVFCPVNNIYRQWINVKELSHLQAKQKSWIQSDKKCSIS